VVGVPDPVMGERVAALILPRPGAELDVPVLLDRVKTRLADFKVPQYVAIAHGPLPRNANGKLLKKQIKADTEWGREIRH
jgi:acyl-CoA synthetase (AMP-forming)/AMP-acid ligase II